MTEALDRPRPGLFDARSKMRDFAIVTYDVDPDALARHLPRGIEPDIFTMDSGARRAFVSAVPFHNDDFRPGFFPFLGFAFGQTNYRAYIKVAGRRAVWFFGTSLASRFVVVPRYVWRLPWHFVRMRFGCTWESTGARYVHSAHGAWGEAEVDAIVEDAPTGRLDGFADECETALVLTHPFDGFLARRTGGTVTYSVWHERLALRRARASRARFRVFEDLGLVARDRAPHSVLVQPRTEFLIFLPPRSVST
jgi:uncharacterized protein YqjF (DUF2071 family)